MSDKADAASRRWRVPRKEGTTRLPAGRLNISDDLIVACLEAHGNALIPAAKALGVGRHRLRLETQLRGIRWVADYHRARGKGTLSSRELEAIHRLNHFNTAPVAEMLGLSKHTAWRVLRRHGLKTARGLRRASWTEAMLRRMYIDEGKSSTEIAAIYEVTPRAVVQQLTKFGIPRRSARYTSATARKADRIALKESAHG